MVLPDASVVTRSVGVPYDSVFARLDVTRLDAWQYVRWSATLDDWVVVLVT